MQPSRKIREYISSYNVRELKKHLKAGDVPSNLIHDALVKFVRSNDIDMIDFTLKHGGKTDLHNSALMRSAVSRADGGVAIIRCFLNNGADPDATSSSVLIEAIKHDNIAAIQELFKHGASFKHIRSQLYSDIVRNGQSEVRKLIISHSERQVKAEFAIDKSQIDLKFLTDPLDYKGGTGLIILAKSGRFKEISGEKFFKDIPLRDFFASDIRGNSVINILAFRGELQSFLESSYFVGKNSAELRTLYNGLPFNYKKEIDLQAVKEKIQHINNVTWIKSKKIKKIKFKK